MPEVKIPFEVAPGVYGELGLKVEAESGLTTEDLLAGLKPFVDDAERDLRRRIEVAQ